MTKQRSDRTRGSRRHRRLSRRRYLATLGVLGAGAGLAGCNSIGSGPRTTTPRTTDSTPPTTVEERIPHESEFEHVIDVLEAGADPTGETALNGLLESVVADDTLLYFPEGNYLIRDMWVVQHRRNIGFVGENATLKPPDGTIEQWIAFDDVRGLLFEGFTLDNSAKETGTKLQITCAGGRNVVRDVVHRGFHDTPDSRTHAFTLKVSGRDTELRLENVDMTDGAADGTAVFVHPTDNPGRLVFENCRIAEWYEQGLYASAHGGPLEIIGGVYANNGIAQIRVGGGNADTRAVIRGATVRVDNPEPADAKDNMRGIWLKEGDNTLIQGCTIEMLKLSDNISSGAIVVGKEHGRVTIRDCHIRTDAPTFGIKARQPETDEDYEAPSMNHPPESWEVTVENVTIEGAAADFSAIEVVDRPLSAFRGLSVDQSGPNRDGIVLRGSPGCRVENVSCVASQYPVVVAPSGGDWCDLELADATLESTALSGGQRVTDDGDGGYCIGTALLDGRDPDGTLVGLTRTAENSLYVLFIDGS